MKLILLARQLNQYQLAEATPKVTCSCKFANCCQLTREKKDAAYKMPSAIEVFAFSMRIEKSTPTLFAGQNEIF